MTDKLSSPSSLSGNGNGSMTSSSNGNGRDTHNPDEPHFVIRQQPPSYVYSNEAFDVEIELELPKTSSPPTTIWANEPIELAATLHYANSKQGRECGNEAMLITEPMRITMPPSADASSKRFCRVRCLIRMDSIRRDTGSVLEVRFSPRQDLSPSVRSISTAATSPIHLVNYKIRLSMEEEWETVWYKDEGGRDKSMEVYASIYDKDGQLKIGEQIVLQPVLCYKVENGGPTHTPVGNQDVLRILGSNKIVVDKDTGRTRIRFRVEDVSKNHQGQDFLLKVGPESKSKTFRDIAPAHTPAVNVRSKRNKRSRNSALSRASKDTAGGYDRVSSPGDPHPRLAYGSVHRPSAATTSGRGGEALFGGPGGQPVDTASLREAMNGIIGWADEVVNGLYPLQWQVLGYAQHADGTPDYARPYHNMPNPNGPINRILSLYSDQVRNNMRTLLDAIEQAGPGAAATPPTAAASRGSEYHVSSASPQGEMYTVPGMHPGGARASMQPSMVPPGDAARGGMYGHRLDMPPPAGGMMPYHARASVPPNMIPAAQQGMSMGLQPYGPGAGSPPANMDEYARIHLPGASAATPSSAGMPTNPNASVRIGAHAESPLHPAPLADDDTRESEVEYILAKQYKALRTGQRLGFPAYSANKDLLGFYREVAGKLGSGSFVPISRHRDEFGPLEIMQATQILEDAMAKKSEAVHALKDWGSVAALLDHALVFDWSKDMGHNSTSAST
mmetsp:Transcript_3435/g.8158  ORF Transcript_3435/g.8158 Transcript_3435/m.8158 type:complete len:730 (-) Transcript_3435:500-2689(-)